MVNPKGLFKLWKICYELVLWSGLEIGTSICFWLNLHIITVINLQLAPFKALYGRKCRAPTCWNEVGERKCEGPKLVQINTEKVELAKQKMKEAQSRQKSYSDKHRRALEFYPGDRVFVKVSPIWGTCRFGIKGKLSPRYVGPFEILERVGEVAYRLALPPQMSHIHNVFHVSLLRGYNYNPIHVIDYLLEQLSRIFLTKKNRSE